VRYEWRHLKQIYSLTCADVIMATLRGSDGSVLIPCDASGRVLEIALLLDAFWAREK